MWRKTSCSGWRASALPGSKAARMPRHLRERALAIQSSVVVADDPDCVGRCHMGGSLPSNHAGREAPAVLIGSSTTRDSDGRGVRPRPASVPVPRVGSRPSRMR